MVLAQVITEILRKTIGGIMPPILIRVEGGVLGQKRDQRGKFFEIFSDSSQIMLKLGRNYNG